MEMKLNSSIQLNKELIAQQISHQEHLRGVSYRTRNMKYQSIKNENKLKNIQSPFGDFPKSHLTGVLQKKTSKYQKSRKPLYELSHAKSNQMNFGITGRKLGNINHEIRFNLKSQKTSSKKNRKMFLYSLEPKKTPIPDLISGYFMIEEIFL